jgi:hypothetical protein
MCWLILLSEYWRTHLLSILTCPLHRVDTINAYWEHHVLSICLSTYFIYKTTVAVSFVILYVMTVGMKVIPPIFPLKVVSGRSLSYLPDREMVQLHQDHWCSSQSHAFNTVSVQNTIASSSWGTSQVIYEEMQQMFKSYSSECSYHATFTVHLIMIPML